jgi:hypothetical protein
MEKLLLVRRYLHNVRSQSTSCKRGRCMSISDGPRMDDRRPQCASHYGVNHGQGLFCFLPSVPLFSNNPALAPFANVPSAATRYCMGGDGAWDHVNSCLQHASNWTCAHDHVLQALESICNAAGFATNHKRVPTSAGNRRADLEIRNIRVAQQTDLLVDVTLRHDFIGPGHSGQSQGQLRNPENPDHILEGAAANKSRNYHDTFCRNRHVAFLPACMSTSGRIHGELLLLLFFLSNRQADDYFAALGYQPHRQEEFCHRSSKTGAPSGWHVLRLWRCVAPPPPRVATSLARATHRTSTRPTMIMTGMSSTSGFA